MELARRAENDAALAFALDGRVGAIIAPDTISEFLALSSELCGVAMRIGDRERLVAGHWNRFMAHVLVGDMAEAGEDLAAASRIAEELKQPVEFFQVLATEAMLALAEGRLADAEKLVPAAFALGETAVPEMAGPVFGLQWYTLCDFRGRLEEARSTVHDLAAAHPTRPLFRCVLALLDAQGGLRADAQRVLDDLAADEFSALPFDQEWLYATSALAETSALLADEASAEVLYGLLVPWADLTATDHPEGTRGAVARYLGLLGATLRRWEAAEAHFEVAHEMNERIGARPWLAHSLSDHARMLVARNSPNDRKRADELFAAALATYRELGMESYAREAETQEAHSRRDET